MENCKRMRYIINRYTFCLIVISIYAMLGSYKTGNYSGVTIPERGIIVGNGVFTYRAKEGMAMMQHEFGHILEYRIIGPRAYWSVIAPESLCSASLSSCDEHHRYWTETWANYLSKKTFWS